ncbi:acyltransferase domain-containing protein [Nocardia sp. 2TAF39]
MSGTAFMFPGQGAYLESVFTDLGMHRREVREVFDEVDGALDGGFGPALSRLFVNAPSLQALLADDPDIAQLALYGTAVAINTILANEGVRPSVLIGHSLGEIAALVAAQALSVGDGAIIVARRNEALRAAAPQGGMLALNAGVPRVSALIDAVDDPGLAVAVVNSLRQVVVSGRTSALEVVADVAHRVGIATAPVGAPYPFHNPLLADAAVLFESSIRSIRRRPLRSRVYSPILGRYYADGDDLPQLLAGHLTRKVDFVSALQYLYGAGVDRFIECGARKALTGIVDMTLPNVTALATVVKGVPPVQSLLGVAHGADQTAAPRTALSTASTFVPPPIPVAAAPVDRGRVLAELAGLYAEAVEYPVDVFTEDADLEGDLGIDSLKQTELMSQVAAKFGLPLSPDDFRVGEHGTLSRIADLIVANGGSSASVAAVRAPDGATFDAEPAGSPVVVAPVDRGRVLAELAGLYAEAVEYPVDVFTEDADLEGDLGIDSLKQTELMSQVAAKFGLPLSPDDFRVGEHGTLSRIADLIVANGGPRRRVGVS